jgi:DNA-binding PadR family transcriptional regulator
VVRRRSSPPPAALAPAFVHVLIALADRERHGYAILKEIRQRTDGRVEISAGSLYGIIRRLHDDGLIVESDERPDPDLDDERRRYYRLTAHGRRALAAEAARMEEVLRTMRAKKLAPQPRPA